MSLNSAFDNDVGYHGACWVDLSDGAVRIDRPVPDALDHFITGVSYKALMAGHDERIGVAYMRVIDASEPENDLLWHRDNTGGGMRFHTAISTDGVPVNLLWHPLADQWEGLQVVETSWRGTPQAPNGEIVSFTTQVHGVMPQLPRPGERTAVFFATLYKTRADADLYVCAHRDPSTTSAGDIIHDTLPSLESQR